MTCEAGVGLKEASEMACELGLSGLEFACGIPGSVGGACFMNAGAYGGSMCPGTFGDPNQLLTYLQTGLIYAVGGCGLYFIVVMGLWDFSIGSVLVLSCLMAIGFSQTMGIFGLIVAPILCGALLGAANGLAYIKLRIPSLIVTVGLSLIYESPRSSPRAGRARVLVTRTRCSARIRGISSWPCWRLPSARSFSSHQARHIRERHRRQRGDGQEHV